MQAPKPKEVHALSGEIIRLERELAAARAKYNALFGITGEEKKTRSASVDGFTAKVFDHINAFPNVEHTIGAVAVILGEDEKAVGKALYKLYAAKRISKPKRGIYQAIEKEASPEEKAS